MTVLFLLPKLNVWSKAVKAQQINTLLRYNPYIEFAVFH